jgi:hypothetical protein
MVIGFCLPAKVLFESLEKGIYTLWREGEDRHWWRRMLIGCAVGVDDL